MRHRVNIDVEVKLLFKIVSDMRPIEQFENDLDRFKEGALTYAIRDTLNQAAYETSVEAKNEIGQKFIERNQYTRRSIRYNKVVGKSIARMYSEVGSVQKYMAKQERGFVTRSKGKHGVAIPTTQASGEGDARVRRKTIRAAARLSRIRIAKGLAPEYARKYKKPRQRLIRMIQDSLEYGYRTIFWMSRRSARTGFYRIRGGKKINKRGWPDGVKLEMLYSVDKPITNTKSHEWLQPSTQKVTMYMGQLYQRALIKEIERFRSFRDRG
jgi:hypothetical protein